MALLRTLFPSRQAGRRAAPKLPEGKRVYAIGDIHGRLDLLEEARDRIEQDLALSPSPDAMTVFTGDYVDRGPDSKGVLDLLLTGKFPPPIVTLQGNHEAMVLAFLANPDVGEVWCRNGGAETLHSYGVDIREMRSPQGFALAARQFRALLPEAHLAFLESLPQFFALGDYFFCHAGVRPGVPLDQQSPEDLIWIRREFLASEADFGKVVVHGHDPVVEPEVRPNRINIDTGAYITNRLTCLVLEGETRRFLESSVPAPAQLHEASA